MTLRNLNISDQWTLFLDRDGVINQRLVDDYVKNINDFTFTEGTLEAMKLFAVLFGKILVVTNQQGIGKGLMSEKQLLEIHDFMCNEISKAGGRIDKVYFCPRLRTENPFCRKPQVGMALLAKKDFPFINFKKSIMAGDSKSDMQFGKRLKMTTVLIGNDNSIAREHPALVDFWFPSLHEMAEKLAERK